MKPITKLIVTTMGIGIAMTIDKALFKSGRGLFLVDTYWQEWPNHFPNWQRLSQHVIEKNHQIHQMVIGAILKANDGIGHVNNAAWFQRQWPRVREVEGYGTRWFRGAYHFLRFARDGAMQADVYLQTIERAGGWSHGDILPIVDVERGKLGTPQFNASREQVIDCVSAWIRRVREITGRPILLYGRGAMRDLQIHERMGAHWLWNPSYTARMRDATVQGWPRDRVLLWQYTDGIINKTNFPLDFSSFGKQLDISVFLGQSPEEAMSIPHFRQLLVEGVGA